MMLLSPSPGQLSDRITILSIKIERGVRSSGSYEAAKVEYTACNQLLDKYIVDKLNSTHQFTNLFVRLENQNRKQWESEDAVRLALKACGDPPTYEQLLQVYITEKPNAEGNEKRAALVREIDVLFEVPPEVKIYA